MVTFLSHAIAFLIFFFTLFSLFYPFYIFAHLFSVEKIPDINDGEKSLHYGHSLRTLLPREKLLLEHVFDGWPEVDQVA